MIPLELLWAVGAAIVVELARAITLWQVRSIIAAELRPYGSQLRAVETGLRSCLERVTRLEAQGEHR